ncbi:MAG: RidA family protein [Alistipes sp.]|jgi:2-iminobutanoate/2-iminopropanoate deaminase|nr:RidA family protein [Alistipes sp.]
MKKIISTTNAPAAIGPYSQAVETGGTLYMSGQLPIDPATGEMPTTIEEQTERVFANIGAILAEAGYGFADVVKSTVLLADMADFGAMNAVYAKYYTGQMPARIAYQVVALPKGALVEIDVVAVK